MNDPAAAAHAVIVGLTGGIGSGKSSVSTRLAAKGATIVDADLVARGLQEPGSPVLGELAERFGAEVITEDGALDRAALAGIVFNDKAAIKALNRIMHPAVRAEMARQTREAVAAGAEVVVQDIPLLVESFSHYPPFSGIVVVDVPPEAAIERLMAHRNFAEADARARVANQASREDRLAIAGFVVDNSGTPDDLDAEVDRCWAWVRQLEPVAASKPREAGSG